MRLNSLVVAAVLCLSLFFIYISSGTQNSLDPTIVTPKNDQKSKENFWVFVMAGQSNMAGRAKIQTEDTIKDENIWMFDESNQWVVAQEPLHYYEPKHTGLDMGVSFAKQLRKLVGDSIKIGLVPCAVGGSSVEKWLGDSIHRNVKLYTNFQNKISAAKNKGSVKGVLWHQGESNANKDGIVNYQQQLTALFSNMRKEVNNDDLPIVIGEIGSFLSHKNFENYPDSINNILQDIAEKDPAIALVKTPELNHRGDSVHFNSESIRKLGQKYAQEYFKLIQQKKTIN